MVHVFNYEAKFSQCRYFLSLLLGFSIIVSPGSMYYLNSIPSDWLPRTSNTVVIIRTCAQDENKL